MATKIRLQRGGRKGYAFYSIVIADVRAPRDGKFTEKIGTYNPNTNPATVDLNFDRALYWVETGAQPTDTVRNILKNEGVYMMKHLRGGVKKGAFDEAACQQKFDAWKAAKDQKNNALVDAQKKSRQEEAAKALDAEKKVNETIAKKVAEKKAAEAAAKAEAEAAKAAEANTEETPAEGEVAPAEASNWQASSFYELTEGVSWSMAPDTPSFVSYKLSQKVRDSRKQKCRTTLPVIQHLLKCRGDRIRTCDHLVPNQERYRTALHPVLKKAILKQSSSDLRTQR